MSNHLNLSNPLVKFASQTSKHRSGALFKISYRQVIGYRVTGTLIFDTSGGVAADRFSKFGVTQAII